MIYLKDLFRLQFHNLHLVAGAKGIDRTVTAAVLFEYDPSRMKLPDFYRGDLVVTTLAYAREDITLVSQSMLALLDQGVAGFLVKTAYFQELPQEVLERANQLHTPIFQFDNTYIEDVILRVTDLIRNKNPFIGYEDTLDSMIRGTFSPAQIRERMRQINPESSFAYGVLTIGKRKAHVSLEERFEHLLNENPNLKKRYIVMGWHGKLVAFCRLQEGEISSTEYAEDLLRCLRSQEGDYYVGISNPCLDPQKIGIFLCESVYAAQKAELEPQFCCTADGLGLYAFIMPLLQDDFAQQQAKKALSRLRNFDRMNKNVLMDTVEAYVLYHLDITKTARVIGQHPNTVRYRLAKVQDFFGISDDRAFEMYLAILVLFSQMEKG